MRFIGEIPVNSEANISGGWAPVNNSGKIVPAPWDFFLVFTPVLPIIQLEQPGMNFAQFST